MIYHRSRCRGVTVFSPFPRLSPTGVPFSFLRLPRRVRPASIAAMMLSDANHHLLIVLLVTACPLLLLLWVYLQSGERDVLSKLQPKETTKEERSRRGRSA